MIQCGQTIADRYTVIKEIGNGGTSVVYLVADRHLGKNFAIKEIDKEFTVDASKVAAGLINEANIMNKLNHPLLPRIIDVLDRPRYVYVVMDYIQGTPLSKVLQKRGAIPQQYVIHWFRQLCEVLTYLHMSKPPIIFRDLKPSNIILTPDGSIRLIDFGAAVEYKQNVRVAAPENNYGTRGYASPEQVMSGITDARSDIYSLGVTMHYLLTGVDPTGPNGDLAPIRKYNPSLSPELEKIVNRCVRYNPKERYANCRELFYDLEELNTPKKNKSNKNTGIIFTVVSIVISAAVFIMTMLIFSLGGMTGGELQIGSAAEILRTLEAFPIIPPI